MLRIAIALGATLFSAPAMAQSQPSPGTNAMNFCPAVPGGTPYESVSLVCYRTNDPYRCHCQHASFDGPVVTPGPPGLNDRSVSDGVLLTNANSGNFAAEQGIDFSGSHEPADRSEVRNLGLAEPKEASEN